MLPPEHGASFPGVRHLEDVADLHAGTATEDTREHERVYIPLTRRAKSGGATFGVDVSTAGISHRRLQDGDSSHDSGKLVSVVELGRFGPWESERDRGASHHHFVPSSTVSNYTWLCSR